MASYRHQAQKLLLKTLCSFSALDKQAEDADFYHARILTGPLRRKRFAMPGLEQVAFGLGTYEPHIVEAMASHVRPGMTAYDVGANAGYHTLVLSGLVGTQGRVFAFEPDVRNHRALVSNLNRNRVDNVTTVAQAVCATTGVVSFASFDYSLVGHIAHEATPDDANLREVPATSIDDWVFTQKHPKPDFIKIDVEGAEEQVLEGATQTLAQYRPAVIAEVRDGDTWNRVSARTQKLGYCAHTLVGGWRREKDGLGDFLFLPT